MTFYYPDSSIEIKLHDAVKYTPWWARNPVLGVIEQLNLQMTKGEGCKGMTVDLAFSFGRKVADVPIDQLKFDWSECTCILELWEEQINACKRRRSSVNFIARFLKRYKGTVPLPGDSVIFIYKLHHPRQDIQQILDQGNLPDLFINVNSFFTAFANKHRDLLISGTPQQITKVLNKAIQQSRKDTYEYMRSNGMANFIN